MVEEKEANKNKVSHTLTFSLCIKWEVCLFHAQWEGEADPACTLWVCLFVCGARWLGGCCFSLDIDDKIWLIWIWTCSRSKRESVSPFKADLTWPPPLGQSLKSCEKTSDRLLFMFPLAQWPQVSKINSWGLISLSIMSHIRVVFVLVLWNNTTADTLGDLTVFNYLFIQ